MEGDVDRAPVPGPVEVGELCREVVAREHVAVEDDHGAFRLGGQGVGSVADRSPGAQRLVLGDVGQAHAVPAAVAEDREEEVGVVGGGEHDVPDAGGRELADLVLQERDPAHLEEVLGAALGQGQHPGAEASGDDDGLGGQTSRRGSGHGGILPRA